MKAGEMTIEEAIRHAEEVAQRKCDECGNQHRQLANWLKELVVLRSKLKVAEDALDKVYKCIDNRYGVDASLLAKNIIADALAKASGESEVSDGE